MMNERSRKLVEEMLRPPEEGGTTSEEVREQMREVLTRDDASRAEAPADALRPGE